MRVSFSTAALYPRPSLESLSLLGKTGYSEAELMPQCMEETKPEFAKETVKTGIRVSSIHFPLVFFSVLYNPYPGMIKEARVMAEEMARSAEIMKSEVVVVHALPKMDAVKERLFEEPVIEVLRTLAEKFELAGVRLAVENNPSTLGDTPQGLLEFLKKLNHVNAFPMVDTTESWEAGIDPVYFIRQARPIHLHLSDHAGDQKHIPAGQGEGDWRAILLALKEIGYSGIYVLEPAYRHYLEDVEAKLRLARKSLDIFL
jgi:sugar phosphate isomerase/epimerase